MSWKRPSTECGNGSHVELFISVGAEGHAASTLGPELGWWDPPCHRAPDNLDLQPDHGNGIDDVEAGDDKLNS